jgi:phosphosulfolactate phosphohydrolase-like enzyme
MNHARLADAIFVTAFVNASATVAKLLERKKIDIVCAGTDGRISDDDILVAGLLVDRIQRQSGDGYLLNAQALTSREFWLNSFALPQAIGAEPLAPERLAERLRNTPGGENLIRVGLDEDILAASYIDRFDIVANLDVQTLRIRHLVD